MQALRIAYKYRKFQKAQKRNFDGFAEWVAD